MVCTANDLQAWKDFPKGLKVLLLDHDTNSATEIRSKLEAMDYIVFTFCNEEEALSAISSGPESFHAAIIEVSADNTDGNFKFLEAARDLPTIAVSNIHCLNTMMKCIALGAVEFLQKPLCEDKLKNIWQHVVHKAFNGRVGNVSESLRPVKESLVPILKLPPKREQKNELPIEVPHLSVPEIDQEHSAGNDKYPAPSTPQLEHGLRSMDDGDCQDHSNGLNEKESGDHDRESKSVETTCDNSMHETLQEGQAQSSRVCMIKDEDESADNSRCENNVPPVVGNKESSQGFRNGADNTCKPSGASNSSGTKVNRKKMKVDWSADLHKKFVQAVEQLGVDQAIPSRILELMKVEGLTRHNVASHLQKYRMHKRHVLPKDDDRRWHQHQHRDSMTRSYYPHRPIMAFPPYHSNQLQAGVVYPVLGASSHPTSIPMWGTPGYPPWQPAESWPWKHPPGIHADAWGCPVLPPSGVPGCTYPQNPPGCYDWGAVDNAMPWNSFDQHPAEEVIDKVVKEAISKPWLPLPLGLKPPSTDCVLAELSRQGIPSIPPHARGSHTH